MEDYLPSIEEQADNETWGSGRYRFNDESATILYLNPTIVKRPDGRHLIARRLQLDHPDDPWGYNNLVALGESNTLGPKRRICFQSHVEGQQDEDPRAFQHGDQTFLSACSYYHYGIGQGWSGAHQLIGTFDRKWTCNYDAYPPIGGNVNGVHAVVERNEKNWAWFMHDQGLCLVYSCNIPWQIVRFGRDSWDSHDMFEGAGIRWPYGTIRAGTNPVLVDKLYWIFFHSSVNWLNFGRRYFMGALAFKSSPPFSPVLVTKEPLIRASNRDQTRTGKPLVVFPCGSIFEKEQWRITVGVNDCYSAWLDIPHKDVYDRCVRINQ